MVFQLALLLPSVEEVLRIQPADFELLSQRDAEARTHREILAQRVTEARDFRGPPTGPCGGRYPHGAPRWAASPPTGRQGENEGS